MPVPESSWLTDAGRAGERVVTGSDKTSLVWYLEGFPTTGSRGASPKSKIVVGERGGLGIAARVPRDRRPMWAYEPPNDGPPERMTRDPTSIRESLPRADIIRGDHGKCCGSRWRGVPAGSPVGRAVPDSRLPPSGTARPTNRRGPESRELS